MYGNLYAIMFLGYVYNVAHVLGNERPGERERGAEGHHGMVKGTTVCKAVYYTVRQCRGLAIHRAREPSARICSLSTSLALQLTLHRGPEKFANNVENPSLSLSLLSRCYDLVLCT